MPIEIEAPDGSVVEFPDGTPDAAISAAMRRAYGGGRNRPRSSNPEGRRPNAQTQLPRISQGRREWDASGWRATPLPRRGQSRSLMQEAEGALAAFNRGIPFSNDISSAGAGVVSMLQGRPFSEGFERQRQRTIDVANDFTTRRPNVSNLATGAGYALPAALSMGASAGPQVAFQGQRAATQAAINADLAARSPTGLPLLANQTARAAAGGGLAGFTFGAGAPEETGQPLQERLQAGNDMAGPGALVGAAAPAVTNLMVPAWRALTRPEPWATQAAESGAGVFGAQALPRRGRPPGGPSTSTVNTIDRLRNRSLQSVDQLEQRVARTRANPQGAVVADLFDDPGVRTMRAIAQGPGQTGQRAAQVAHQRFSEAPDRILNDLNRRLAVAETPDQALAALDEQYKRVSAELFQPLWAQEISPAARTRLATRFAAYQGNPVMEDAARRAQFIFDTARGNGTVQGEITDNLPRFLHYMKMGLDDAAFAARMPQSGIGRTALREVQEMRLQFVRMLDDTIPGYQHARRQWGGVIEAQEALEEGAALLRQNHNAVAARMRGWSPFARYHARVGFANELANRLGLRGSVNGNRNVAEALGSPELQRRVAAMFDSPEQAAAFLDTMNTQNMLMRNAGQWGSGSQTYSNAMHGADETMNALAEMGVRAAQGNPVGAVRRGVEGVANVATMGAIERRNNQVGADLLRRVDSEDERAFIDQVLRILREREAQRTAVTAVSPATGAAAAAAEQRTRRNRR